ncbi:hypothetical protein HDU93_007813, partial [Gonapodya sp. JEL0774]
VWVEDLIDEGTVAGSHWDAEKLRLMIQWKRVSGSPVIHDQSNTALVDVAPISVGVETNVGASEIGDQDEFEDLVFDTAQDAGESEFSEISDNEGGMPQAAINRSSEESEREQKYVRTIRKPKSTTLAKLPPADESPDEMRIGRESVNLMSDNRPSIGTQGVPNGLSPRVAEEAVASSELSTISQQINVFSRVSVRIQVKLDRSPPEIKLFLARGAVDAVDEPPRTLGAGTMVASRAQMESED